jgi:hypothetical protein
MPLTLGTRTPGRGTLPECSRRLVIPSEAAVALPLPMRELLFALPVIKGHKHLPHLGPQGKLDRSRSKAALARFTLGSGESIYEKDRWSSLFGA